MLIPDRIMCKLIGKVEENTRVSILVRSLKFTQGPLELWIVLEVPEFTVYHRMPNKAQFLLKTEKII